MEKDKKKARSKNKKREITIALKPLKPPPKSATKIIKLGKRKDLFPEVKSNRPPWNDTVLMNKAHATHSENCYMKHLQVPLPQPDFEVWPVKKYHLTRDGRAVRQNDMLLWRETNKIAPWCSPPPDTATVTHAEYRRAEHFSSVTKVQPNSYRHVYVDDAFQPIPCVPLSPGSLRVAGARHDDSGGLLGTSDCMKHVVLTSDDGLLCYPESVTVGRKHSPHYLLCEQ